MAEGNPGLGPCNVVRDAVLEAVSARESSRVKECWKMAGGLVGLSGLFEVWGFDGVGMTLQVWCRVCGLGVTRGINSGRKPGIVGGSLRRLVSTHACSPPRAGAAYGDT